MPKRRLMVLGAGLCQVPIIRKAQGMGFEVIAVSIPGDYPGFEVADRSYRIDVREKEEILAIAQIEGISGILTDQTDISVPTVASVAEKMGLPGIGYNCALSFTNKFEMRKRCVELGVPVPDFVQASSPEIASQVAEELGFPLMVKPVDNQGSRGVAKVDDSEELRYKVAGALAHSVCGSVILERFLPSREIVVQAFVSDYQVTNLAAADRLYFDLPGRFIPKETLFPSTLDKNLLDRIFRLNTRLLKGFGPRFGISHNEFLVDVDTGEIWLGEAAIRGGGVFISSDLVPLACGVDVNELLIRLVSGEERVTIDRARLQSRASGYACFYLPEGVISRVTGRSELQSLPGVHQAYLEGLEPGSRTSPISNKAMRLGPVLVAAQDREALDKTIRRVQQTLVVEVDTADGIKGIEW